MSSANEGSVFSSDVGVGWEGGGQGVAGMSRGVGWPGCEESQRVAVVAREGQVTMN